MDISGGMIVGESGGLLEVPDNFDGEFYEWAENEGLDCMPEHYDASPSRCYYGFTVPDIPVDEITSDWVSQIKKLAQEFERITGVKARLIGTQDVW